MTIKGKEKGGKKVGVEKKEAREKIKKEDVDLHLVQRTNHRLDVLIRTIALTKTAIIMGGIRIRTKEAQEARKQAAVRAEEMKKEIKIIQKKAEMKVEMEEEKKMILIPQRMNPQRMIRLRMSPPRTIPPRTIPPRMIPPKLTLLRPFQHNNQTRPGILFQTDLLQTR